MASKSKSKSDNGTAPAFDLSAVQIGAPVPMPASKRAQRFVDNPLVPQLRQSSQLGQAGQPNGIPVTVPAEHVRALASALRDASSALEDEKIGVSIVYTWGDGEQTTKYQDVPETGAQVTVTFRGKPRKSGLNDEERAEALREGFTVQREDGSYRANTVEYRKWVAAGRPAEMIDDDGIAVDPANEYADQSA